MRLCKVVFASCLFAFLSRPTLKTKIDLHEIVFIALCLFDKDLGSVLSSTFIFTVASLEANTLFFKPMLSTNRR